MASKSSHGNNVIPSHITQIASRADASQGTGSGSVHDPKCAKRKGAPRKLRKKYPLESSSKKVKVIRKISILTLCEVTIHMIYNSQIFVGNFKLEKSYKTEGQAKKYGRYWLKHSGPSTSISSHANTVFIYTTPTG